MKKAIVIVLAAGLVLTIGLRALYVYKMRTAELRIEKILPENAAVYICVSDIEKRLQELEETRLWRNIKNIDVEKVMEKSGLPAEMIEQYRTSRAELATFASGLVLDKFFGQEIALAVYTDDIKNIDISNPDPEAIAGLASNIVLVTRLKPEAKFIEMISKVYNKINQQVNIKYETYKKHKITLIELADGVHISYVKIEDLLVVGLTTKGTHLCIDVFSKDKTSLARDKNFISTMANLPKLTQLVGYGNLKLFISDIKDITDTAVSDTNVPTGIKEGFSKHLAQFSGFQTVGFASVSGKISKGKYIVTFDKNKLDAKVAKTYSAKPQRNNTINFVPKGIIGYQWFNCFDLKSTLDSFREASRRSKQDANLPSPQYFIKSIEEGLGLSIEDEIIPALGNEAGGFLADIDLSGPFPVPQILFFIKVKSKPAAENILNVLTKKNNISLQAEDYKNTLLKYMVLPFGTNIQPAYCFLENYLLIAVNRQLLKDSVDAYSDRTMSLVEDTDFKTVNFGLTGENNSIAFLKTNLLLNKIQEIAEWAFSWYSMMSSMRASAIKQMEIAVLELEKTIQQKQVETEKLNTKFELLKKEKAALQEQGLDILLKEKELATLKTQIETKEEDLKYTRKDLERKKRSERKKPLGGNIDVSVVRLLLDEIAYPVLDGLKVYKTTSSRIIFGEGMLENESFTNVEE